MLLSASRLPILQHCAAAAVLPQVGSGSMAADVGTAGHEHMHLRATAGVDDAMAAIPEICARLQIPEEQEHWLTRRLERFTWTPPAGTLAELALVLMQDGSVRLIDGGRGDYPELEGALQPGQVDLVWAEPRPLVQVAPDRFECPEGSILWVADYKFGQDRYVEPIEQNDQLAGYGVLAARWTGAKRVMLAVIYPGEGEGDWDVLPAPWREREIAEQEKRLRRLQDKVNAARATLDAGGVPNVVEGQHCTFCDAQLACPAKVGLLKRVTAGQADPGAELTRDEAAFWVTSRRILADVQTRVEAALHAHVEAHGPIQMPDGTLWGPVTERKTAIVATQAREVLREELDDHVDQAIHEKVSRSSIEEAIKAKLHGARGVAPIMRRVMARLGEAGALVSAERVEWKLYRPAAERAPTAEIVEDLDATG